MADNQEKKSFYAVNLTEGRMFGVFIGIVLVLVAIFFAIMVTAFRLSKPKSGFDQIRTETIEKKQQDNAINETTYSFYSDAPTEESVKQEDVVTKEVIRLSQNVPENASNTQASEVSKTEQEHQISIEEPQLSVDNSEVLYSSRYQQNMKFKKDEEKPAQQTQAQAASQPTQSKVTQTKSTEQKVVANMSPSQNVKTTDTKTVQTQTKEKSVRYVVQVGSYTNKKIADEIAQHYEKSGYPVYQQEFAKDGQTYYRLRVGPFKEKDRAENYLLSIKDSKYGKNSYISKIFI